MMTAKQNKIIIISSPIQKQTVNSVWFEFHCQGLPEKGAEGKGKVWSQVSSVNEVNKVEPVKQTES